MITRYVLPALLVALLGAAGLAWWQSSTIDTLRGELETMRVQSEAMRARQNNIEKDRESDAEIDNLPDDGLRAVPDHWMRGSPGDGGLY